MENSSLKNALSAILKIEEPWFIENIIIQDTNQVVDIFISFERGSRFPCSECEKNYPVHDSNYKRIRHLDLMDYRCYLNVKVPRTNCITHGIKVITQIPWSRPGSHFSFSFESKIMQLVAHMAMSAIANYFGESDSTFWRVFNYYVNKSIKSDIKLKLVRRVCVDETAIKRGHSYTTIFTDFDTGQVIYVTEGRKKEVFEEFKNWLKLKGGQEENIKIFSMDMSKSYKAGQKEFFEDAKVIFDRFHIKKAVNEAVDKVRRLEAVENEELKKTKYIWLKNIQNLTKDQALKVNDFLHDSVLETVKAYRLKSEFDNIWNVQPLAVEATLKSWLERAKSVYLRPINYLIKTIQNNYQGIINSMKSNITNAVSEGINSKIQMAKSRARGFRNFENLKAIIYYLGNDFKFQFHNF
jgi:transposase